VVDLNATLTPILTQIINLFPSLLDLVLAALPIIIAMALDVDGSINRNNYVG
jgi:hypothetical protein